MIKAIAIKSFYCSTPSVAFDGCRFFLFSSFGWFVEDYSKWKGCTSRTFLFDKSDSRGHCRLLRWKAEAFEVCSRKFNFAALPLASALIPFMNFNDLIKYFISLAGLGGNFDVVKKARRQASLPSLLLVQTLLAFLPFVPLLPKPKP